MFWVANGLLFVALLLGTGQWRRLVPTSWSILSDAWAIQVHYMTFHLPVEPNGFYRYNALQQLAYFGVVFILAPLQILTGLAMSPAIDNHFKWYGRLFGNRQAARSIHFLGLLGFLGFIMAHVTMVLLTGLARNMNHIVVGTDDLSPRGLILGVFGVGVVVAACVLANWVTWRQPRLLQATARVLVQGLTGRFLDPLSRAASILERTSRPISGPTARSPPVMSGRDWRPTLSATTASSSTARWWTRSSSRSMRSRPWASGADYAPPLYSGLVGHRRMGRRVDRQDRGSRPALPRSHAGRLPLVWRGSALGRALRHANPPGTHSTPRAFWPTR